MNARLFAVIAAALAFLLSPKLPVLAVTEIDQPPCRWFHYYGGDSATYISYRWGSNLQGTSLWRTAFEQSLQDWNNTPTRLLYYFDSYGDVHINTYWGENDGLAGFAVPYCSGTTTIAYDVMGNTYYDALYGYSSNHRRSVTGHELGHGWSLGHITDPGTALLGNNPDPETYYTPQQLDIDLVNQVYW